MYKKYNTLDQHFKNFLAGIGLGQISYAIKTAFINDGSFHFVSSKFIDVVGGSEIKATIISMLVCGVIGLFVFFNNNKEDYNKSLLQIFTSKFIQIFIPIFIAAIVLKWVPFDLKAILIFIAIFIVIFLIIGLAYYISVKKDIEELNQKIK